MDQEKRKKMTKETRSLQMLKMEPSPPSLSFFQKQKILWRRREEKQHLFVFFKKKQRMEEKKKVGKMMEGYGCPYPLQNQKKLTQYQDKFSQDSPLPPTE